VQQLPLSHQLSLQKRYARDIASRAVEAGEEPRLDRVNTVGEDDRNGRGGHLGDKCRRGTRCDDHIHLAMNQIGGEPRQSVVLAFRPAIFDRRIPAFDIADFVEASPEGNQTSRDVVGLGDPTLR
jgi:hypothetical protein